MSEAHVCNFTFEKNVMHIHVKHAAPGAQQALHRQAGKYTCSCGAFDLLDPLNTPQAIAQALNGMEYPLRIPKAIAEAARISGVVIVSGGSDDLMLFEGAIHDDFGCYDGGAAKVDAKGVLRAWDSVKVDGNKAEIAEWLERDKTAKAIQAIWEPIEPWGASWAYETSIPHATFDVMEDGGIYCRAIAFNLADLEAPKVQHLPSDDTEGGAI